MQTFAIKEDGKYVGLLLTPEDGDLLSEDTINSLMPVVNHVLAEANLECDLSVKDHYITINGQSEMNKILDVLKDKITEKVIVPQAMGNGPAIRHRPLSFLEHESDQIEVRFKELGDFNNFGVALSELKDRYSLL